MNGLVRKLYTIYQHSHSFSVDLSMEMFTSILSQGDTAVLRVAQVFNLNREESGQGSRIRF